MASNGRATEVKASKPSKGKAWRKPTGLDAIREALDELTDCQRDIDLLRAALISTAR